ADSGTVTRVESADSAQWLVVVSIVAPPELVSVSPLVSVATDTGLLNRSSTALPPTAKVLPTRLGATLTGTTALVAGTGVPVRVTGGAAELTATTSPGLSTFAVCTTYVVAVGPGRTAVMPVPPAAPFTVKLAGVGVATGWENVAVKLTPSATAPSTTDRGAADAAAWAAARSAGGTASGPPRASTVEMDAPLVLRKPAVSAGNGSSSSTGDPSSDATSASGNVSPDASTTVVGFIPRPPDAAGVISSDAIAAAVAKRVAPCTRVVVTFAPLTVSAWTALSTALDTALVPPTMITLAMPSDVIADDAAAVSVLESVSRMGRWPAYDAAPAASASGKLRPVTRMAVFFPP